MGLIMFNLNGGSEFSPDMVGAAFLLEPTGSPASNTTGQVVREKLSSSTAVQVQSASEGTSTPDSVMVGTGRDLYCFQNDPYECEGYFGDARIQLTGTQRCSACEGNPFTGIGLADGAITPAPLGFDDDDGLSQMGQERAQGGTPSPAGVGGGAGSGSDISSSGENGGGGVGGPGSDAVEGGGGGDPELLGVTGSMRWVVLGLTVGLGAALLVCLCLLAVCGVSKKRKKAGHERVQAGVEERQSSPVHRAGAGSRSKAAVAPFYSVTSKNQLVALSPSTPAAQAHSGWGNKSASRSISRRGSRSSSDAATPASQRNALQRVMDMSAEADRRAENIFCATRPPTEGREANAKETPQAEKRRGVAALPGSLPDDSSRATEGEGLFFAGRSAKERGNGSGQTTRSEEYGGREKKYRNGSRSRSLDRSSGHVKSRVSDVSDDVDTQGKITWVPTDLRQAPPFRSKGSAKVYSKKSFDSSKSDC